jgi:hypothetical protein
MASAKNASEILRAARLLVSPETFHIVSLPHDRWESILANPDLSPRMESEFLIFKDKWEVTLVLDDGDFINLRPGLDSAKIESGFRLLSFDAELEFDVVGFMSEIAGILASAGISILPFSSFSRDHVLLRQDDLAAALKAFRGRVDEVC